MILSSGDFRASLRGTEDGYPFGPLPVREAKKRTVKPVVDSGRKRARPGGAQRKNVENADAGDEASVTSEVADTWQTFTDDGGDTGYATEIGDEALLVYGSAPAGDIEAFMGLLTR